MGKRQHQSDKICWMNCWQHLLMNYKGMQRNKRQQRTLHRQWNLHQMLIMSLDAAIGQMKINLSLKNPSMNRKRRPSKRTPWEANENSVPPHKEKKYVVFESKLMELLKVCPSCKCTNVALEKREVGTLLVVTRDCLGCNEKATTWESQPWIGSYPAGNLLLSAAVLFAGGSCSDTLRVLKHYNVTTHTQRTFYRHQNKVLHPAITHQWQIQQDRLLTELSEQGLPLTIGGDGRADSPGHSAKFGVYTAIELNINKIVDFQLVQSNEVKSSYHMELEGYKRATEYLTGKGLVIRKVVTDRHRQLAKYIRDTSPDTIHVYDVWHVAKGVRKKVHALAKQKDCEELLRWEQSISNHVYWVAATCEEEEHDLRAAKWKSLMNHMQGIHEGHSEIFPNCLHGDLEAQGCRKKWLKPGTKACEKLQGIVQSTMLMNDVKKLSGDKQTSSLESYHSLVNRYAPKLKCYSYEGMTSRYLTSKEWSTFYGGKKADSQRSEFRRLPFDHCSLSLQPFEHPYCTLDGIIFDLMSIVPFIKKYKANPITGQALDAKSLIKLHFHKNTDGKYHCPVTFKVFNQNTHIVAVKTTGNVYCYEAMEQLNIKAKNWKDLLTDEAFKRSDIITIQDPSQLDKFNISKFHHIKNNLKVEDEAEKKARKDPKYTLNKTNVETEDILGTLYKEYQPSEMKEEKKQRADKLNAAHYSTGMVAAGFTSTAMAPQTIHEAAVIDEDIIRYERVKKKGYVRMNTNKGTLNIELRCDLVPKTCENFMKLCAKSYYNGTKFHRSIKNFMIQGGDPTGTGTGGESIWGKPFKDEFKPNLSHTGRGILSMANSGPDTNKSQFFITFRSCKYLDEKHTIFGSVVGGLDTLNAMEKIETDEKDKPLKDIVIQDTVLFVDPYEEVDKEISEERLKLKLEEDKKSTQSTAIIPGTSDKPRVYRSGVGKYLAMTSVEDTKDRPSTSTSLDVASANSSRVTKRPGDSSYEGNKKKVKNSMSLSDFSAW